MFSYFNTQIWHIVCTRAQFGCPLKQFGAVELLMEMQIRVEQCNESWCGPEVVMEKRHWFCTQHWQVQHATHASNLLPGGVAVHADRWGTSGTYYRVNFHVDYQLLQTQTQQRKKKERI